MPVKTLNTNAIDIDKNQIGALLLSPESFISSFTAKCIAITGVAARNPNIKDAKIIVIMTVA